MRRFGLRKPPAKIILLRRKPKFKGKEGEESGGFTVRGGVADRLGVLHSQTLGVQKWVP